MKMIRLTGILFLILSGYCQAQQAPALIREAREFYDLEQYARAATRLEEAMNLETTGNELHYLLAECYRHTFQYEQAIIYYEKVAYANPEAFPLSYYYLGLMQKYMGDCPRSILSMDQFIRRFEDQKDQHFFIEQAYIEQAGCRFSIEESLPETYSLRALDQPLNSKYNDFATVHLADSALLLTSGRPGRGKGYDARYGEAFTDMYFFARQTNAWSDQTRDRARLLNGKYNEGSGSYSPKRQEYYFTQCGANGPDCQLFRARYENGEWTDPVPLSASINLAGYDSKQPAISVTGDTLFFVSDRPGGKGGTDIWISLRQQDQFGPPANLGPSVNTSLNEASPHCTPFHNLLLFSSNGHQGYGGYDIFLARRLSGGDTTLVNIGPPFNSSYDDLYPELHLEKFYLSSNRPGGAGNFDVYGAETGRPLVFLSRLNATRQSAKRSDVKLESRRSESIRDDLFTMILEDRLEYEQLTDQERTAVDRLVEGDYDEELLQDFSQADQNSLIRFVERRKQLLSDSGRIVHPVTMEPVAGAASYVIRGKIKSVTGKQLDGIQLYIKNNKGEVIMISGVSKDGSFQFNNIQSGHVRIESDLIPSELQKEIFLENVSYDPFRLKLKNMENIYFDLDRYHLRPEARIYLGELARIFDENKNAQLEIFAYTDDTGTDSYNMILSKHRAEAVRDFLIQQGVRPDQLMINPQGKEFTDGKRSGLERQLSRRVAFKVYDLMADRIENKNICFTRHQSRRSEVLKSLGVDEEVLTALNGELPVEFRPFQPVRVPQGIISNETLHCVQTDRISR